MSLNDEIKHAMQLSRDILAMTPAEPQKYLYQKMAQLHKSILKIDDYANAPMLTAEEIELTDVSEHDQRDVATVMHTCVSCQQQTTSPMAITGGNFYPCEHCGNDQFNGETLAEYLSTEANVAPKPLLQAQIRPIKKHSHYFKNVQHLNYIDIYRIIELYDITCPVAQHILKKSMAAGKRGAKDQARDMQEIADSAARWLDMRAEDKAA